VVQARQKRQRQQRQQKPAHQRQTKLIFVSW
jgi:hypothetical protein